MGIENKAMLVYVNISQATFRRFDKTATQTVKDKHATDLNAGNYTKKLLPGAKELAKITTQAGSIRTYYYAQTLPWFSDGARIISSKNYFDFIGEFNRMKTQFQDAVSDFISAYPSLKAEARSQLGDLFNSADYPSVFELRDQFKCEAAFMPVPAVSDFRTEILDSEKEEFMSRIREVEFKAMDECRQKLRDVVNSAVTKLKEPKAIFRDTLITNIQDICKLLPKLSIADDPQLEVIRQEVATLTADISPTICRESASHRQDAAAKLAAIQDKMAAFMGVEYA